MSGAVWCSSLLPPFPRRWLCRPQLLLLLLLATALFTLSLQSSWSDSQWAASAAARADQTAPAMTADPAAAPVMATQRSVSAVAAAVAPAAPAAPEAPEAPAAAAVNPAMSRTGVAGASSPPRPPPAGPSVTDTAIGRHQRGTEKPPSVTSSLHQTVMAERMRQRRDRIRQACEANPKYVAPAITDSIFYDQTHAMVWCPIFKAGSSNWLNLLCEVHKLKHKTCPIEILRRHLGKIYRYWKVPASVRHRFLVVRHPFERLLSAFRDKIETHGRRPGQPYWTKAVRMVRLHRRKDAIPRPVSAAELYGPPQPLPPGLPPSLTFPEFLRSVARQDIGDEHWKPYFAQCTPCNVDYDLIGKFETLEEDNRYIAAQLGIKEHVEMLLPQLGNRNKRGPTGSTSKKYFSQVTRSELVQVHKMFMMDFIMFNYTMGEYLEYAKPDDDYR